MTAIQIVGLIGSIVLPLWNIPLIMRMRERKSSRDVSLSWAVGVWICILLMGPAGLQSSDIVWRVYTVINTIFFTAVVTTVLKYRKGGDCKPE